MSEYIPKVGDEFEWSYKGAVSWTRAKANCVTDKAIGYEDSKGWIVTVCKSCNFRPIQTKADVEREQLEALLADYVSAEISSTVFVIQKAGFTIPKKVKRSELNNFIGDWCDNPKMLVDELCNLLGDLVEGEA